MDAMIDTGATPCTIPKSMRAPVFGEIDPMCKRPAYGYHGSRGTKDMSEVFFAHILVQPAIDGYRSPRPIILRDVRFLVSTSREAEAALIGMSALSRLDLHINSRQRLAVLIQR